MYISLKKFSLFWLLLLTLLPVARAEPLQQLSVEAYVNSLEAVRQLGERMQAEGRQDFLQQEVLPNGDEPFDPHQRGVKLLARESSDDYRELSEVVRQHGFTSAESWARVGDRVVLAYGAIKAEAESPEILQMASQMEAMDPQMLELLPPDVRRQMDQALAIARAIAAVPQADREQVRPFVGQLDRIFSR